MTRTRTSSPATRNYRPTVSQPPEPPREESSSGRVSGRRHPARARDHLDRSTITGDAARGAGLDQTVDALRLAVTRRDRELNRDGVGIRLHPEARPTETVSIDDIVAAPAERRDELLRRYHGFMRSKLGELPADPIDAARLRARIEDGPWAVEARDQIIAVTLEQAGEPSRRLTVDLSAADQPALSFEPPLDAPERGDQLAFLLKAFTHLLFKTPHATRGGVDPAAPALFHLLLGPGGALNPQEAMGLPASQRFVSPKLIAWDFNGTVGDGRGRFRPDMADVTDNLNRMGAASIVTTTIDPIPVEKLMEESNIHFNGYFGRQEVRDYPSNKHYQGVADAWGLDPSDAPARMAVVGDSATDIPSDLPGVLFLHNDDRTPAEALQLLLHTLDQEGQGSLAEGMRAVLGGRDPGASPTEVKLGHLSFTVAMRDGGSDQRPCPVPVVSGMRIHYPTDDLSAVLTSEPPADALDDRAVYCLGLRYIEGSLEAERLPEVLRSLRGAGDRPAVLAAGALRIEQREGLVERAREITDQLLQGTGFMPMDDLRELCAQLADVGDTPTAAGLARFARDFPSLNAAERPQAEQLLVEDRDALRDLLGRALDVSADASADVAPVAAGLGINATTEEAFLSKSARGVQRLLEKMAEDPMGAPPRARVALLKKLEAFVDRPFPGATDSLEKMAQALDTSFSAAAQGVEALFTDREQRAAELDGIAARARDRAPGQEQLWHDVRAAWGELADAPGP